MPTSKGASPLECTIALSVQESNRQFRFHIQIDDSVLASNRTLSPEDSQRVRDISLRYGAMFEHRTAAYLSSEQLVALGTDLFNLWLSPVWDNLLKVLTRGVPRILLIASAVPEILNLPWELLRPTGRDFMGFDAQFAIRRYPWPHLPIPRYTGELPGRPLRILFVACSPKDEAELDYEREERALLQAIGKAGPDVALDSGDLGTFEELQGRIAEFEPQIVHLTGHATLGRMCPRCRKLSTGDATHCPRQSCASSLDGVPTLGYFAFEDERGNADPRSSVEIRQQLFAATSVQCAFISSCQAGKAPPVAALGGLCQGLVSEEVPFSIGWAASIADTIATQFAESFYRFVAVGQSIDLALVHARQGIRQQCENMADPSWTLPVLYTATTQRFVFDKGSAPPTAQTQRKSMVQAALPGMTQGYAVDFVNRRRELQRLLPGLRDGTIQALIITGLGGSGKSTLATRLARKLETDRFRLIAVPSSAESPLTAARLLDTCSLAFLDAKMRDAYETLQDPTLPVEHRCCQIVSVLNNNRFVLVIDNFETNIDEASHKILDPQVLAFYKHLSANLSGGSRVIVTSRYEPAL